MAKVVITGGAGFIGSNLALRLINDGHEVTIYDNLSLGKSPLLGGKEKLVRADIINKDQLINSFRGTETVFHHAAIRSIPLSMKEPLKVSQTNILGTLNVLEAARRCDVGRVILASSSSVYGNSNPPPFNERMTPDPVSFYAVSKVVNEQHAKLYSESYGIHTVCLRYFTVFGYGQDGSYEYSLAIPRFIDMMREGKRPVVFGDGKASRDFTFVDNVVDANLLAMGAGSETSGKVFNIGQGESTTILEIISLLNALLGTDITPIHQKERSGDVSHTLADLNTSSKVLGYSPKISMREGLGKTVDWYKSWKNRSNDQAAI